MEKLLESYWKRRLEKLQESVESQIQALVAILTAWQYADAQAEELRVKVMKKGSSPSRTETESVTSSSTSSS